MNYMNNNPIIIGIDHGYGNIKTAHCCFPTGVIISDKEPTFKSNLLVYNGSYYTVGEGHKEFISDKMTDGDYYMKQIYTTTLRLNLENEADRRAWEHLQSLDRREYRSVSKAVVSAVNAYFDRSKQLADDPYLETREKEDAFLSRIEDTISRSLQSCTPVSLGGILQLMQSAQPAAALVSEETEEDISAALDFADGF